MADGTVGWHFFDVESGNLPEGCAPSILPMGGRGRIVVLAASPFALSRSWAARAAVAIARDWAEQGLRVFLMDLALETPTLHELVGLPNEEGVSDAFLYGASVQRIARQALDGAIYFASAGTPTGDPEEVLGHPRWGDLAVGFSEADATLLLFLPAGIPGSARILGMATDIVFLAAQGESADLLLGPASVKVATMVGPLGSPLERDVEASSRASGPESSDVFGASLDLASGFGEEEEGPEAGDLDFELAQGFDGPLPPAPDDARPQSTAPAAAPEETMDRGGFGSDLVMGADVSGSLGARAEMEGGAVGPASSTPPDFGAEFVDLPPVDDEVEGFGGEGEFGDALVHGPDFGLEASPSLEHQEPSEIEGVPANAANPPPRVDRDALLQEKARTAPRRRSPPKKKFPLIPALVAAALVIFAAAAVGTVLGYIDVPGLTFLRQYFGEIPDPPLVAEGAQPVGATLQYSLVVRTYREDQRAFASEMQDALRTALPGFHYILVPQHVEGELRYVLMAGPALDRAEADSLRELLTTAMPREDPSSWSVVETPRAFLLGRRDSFAEAMEALEWVESEGIPAYLLHSTFEDGTEGYQILSGAFSGVEGGRSLQLILRNAGFRDAPLIVRRGRLPE